MDFAKSFTCFYWDKVASAHWKTNSGTFFTVMLWFQKESISVVIVSDNKHQDKRTFAPYSFTVFNYVKEMFKENIENIAIGIDGSFVQFKNKFIFGFIGLNLAQLFLHYHLT